MPLWSRACGTTKKRRATRPENLPSQGVAGKLDMTPEKRTLFHGLEHIVFAAFP